jgi:membrane-bound lytic murein transglycosylase A
MRQIFAIIALTLLAACSSPGGQVSSSLPAKLVLEPIRYSQIAGWGEDNQSDALSAFLKSCGAFGQMQDNDATGEGELLAPAVVWREVCRKAQTTPLGDAAIARKFFEQNFIAARVTNNGDPQGLITGYFEPMLKGSRTQQRPYVYPIYGLPYPGTPAYSRTQIDLGILNGHAPVIAYTDDPVRLFFMHVQGSGRMLMDNGSIIRFSYAGTNGLPYTSIGKALVDEGLLDKDQVTMPVLRQWLYDHPADMWKVMWENKSYIFFKETQGDPTGTEQVGLTPGRSIAVDMRYIPLGAPVFVDTVLPVTPEAPMAIHRKLMVAQDSGSAIKGPTRVDIFFGFGAAAEEVAGRMKSGGMLVVLLPRPLARTALGSQ